MAGQFTENDTFILKGDTQRTKLRFLRYPKVPKLGTFPLELVESYEEVIVQHPTKGEFRYKVIELEIWDGRY